MDEKVIVKTILDSYEVLEVSGEDEGITFFLLDGKEYGLWYPYMNMDTQRPIILIKNEGDLNYPHFLQGSIPWDDSGLDKYRVVCLYENDSTINFLQSYEEKIRETVERLIELVSLTPLEREREYQKEFLYYWNNAALQSKPISLYIGDSPSFKKMNVYQDGKGDLRFVSAGIRLNDYNKQVNNIKKWKHLPGYQAFYIPIVDKRRIIPPFPRKAWTSDDILNIICGREFNRIDSETYIKLSEEKIKSNNAFLVFEMNVEGNLLYFTTLISFKRPHSDTLLNCLKNDIVKVQCVISKRVDYSYLSKQIGNDIKLYNKKVLLVGAGSLGSYLAHELVKVGIKEIIIYDDDIIEDENLLRYSGGGYFVGTKKVSALQFELHSIHPEINVKAVCEKMDEKSLVEEAKNVDLIIFTVGSSDLQLRLNRVLKEIGCKKKTVYAWLEAGGINSHILLIDYNKPGCFQCLYTDSEGKPINNRANNITDIDVFKIRNGCGATRVAYGNTILLRTVAVLLDVIKNVFEECIESNTLFDIMPTQVENKGNAFVEGNCRCCGN